MPIFRALSTAGLLAVLLLSTAAVAREVVHAPAGGEPGTAIYEPDLQPPLRPTTVAEPIMGSRADIRAVEIGGDDVQITSVPQFLDNESMDIAANGDIYVAVTSYNDTDSVILIHRSTDGGTTFSLVATLDDPAPGVHLQRPSLVVAEGVESRCYVAYVRQLGAGDSQIVVAWENLDATTFDFADRITAFSNAGDYFNYPALIADDSSFSSFYLYLVAEAGNGFQSDIWFTRSTDQGASWGAAYEIATTGSSGLLYSQPTLSYGFGSHIHVTWWFRSFYGAFDSAIRYRRADNDADGGLADWGSIRAVTATDDGLTDTRPRIVSAHDGNDVVLAYSRFDSGSSPTGPILHVAADAGALGFSASPGIQNMLGTTVLQDLLRDPDTGAWYAALGYGGDLIRTAPWTSPESWSELGLFQGDHFFSDHFVHRGRIATDPTRGHRVAVCRSYQSAPNGFFLDFDAEWFADPGYPVQRDGFPLDLAAAPVSDPALVDVDGDGDLEIVFGDAAGNVHAVRDDGSELPGWPVNVGSLSSSPIACGRLTLSDEITVVAGTADGRVVALKPDGSVAAGFPFDLGTGAPMYVSIGALGGPFPRSIVLASGDTVMFLDHAGRWTQDSLSRQNIGHVAVQPCAIGDLDGDGVAEVIVVWDTGLSAFKRDVVGSLFETGLPEDISGPVTLGDADLDGDLEIAVPLADGTMHLLDDTGVEVPGWPFVSTADSPLSGAAWANVAGGDEPELAFASAAWKIHLVDGGGVELGGFPVKPSIGWFLYTSPVIEQIDGFLPDLAIGTRGSEGWAFNVAGGTMEGWPRQLGAPCERTPAVADLDQDGFNELVLLTTADVQAFDLRTAPFGAPFAWPMAGHDAQRTGCSDCPEDVVTAVGDPELAASTRVSFAPPHPNPTSASAVFSFAMPVRAVVSLEVLDVRGRRVRTVERSELPAGDYVLGWDGRDERRQPVGGGVYYARLRVRGPGVDEMVTRKVTVMR